MPMRGRSPVVAEPLLQHAVPINARWAGKVLTVVLKRLFMLVGLFVVVLWNWAPYTHAGTSHNQDKLKNHEDHLVTLVSAMSRSWHGHAASGPLAPHKMWHGRHDGPHKRPHKPAGPVVSSLPHDQDAEQGRFSGKGVPLAAVSDSLLERGQSTQKEELLDVQKLVDRSNVSVPSPYHIRPFDPARDQKDLEKICRKVYGGTDYLPKVAASLASDPASRFLVLEDNNLGQLIAVGNVRKVKPNMGWLEGVRTSEEHRGKGFAGMLTKHLIDQCKMDNHQVYTCTSQSNRAMQRIFDKVGMVFLNQIHQLSFSKLKQLPGWSSEDDRPGQSLFKVTGLEGSIGESARTLNWSRVQNEDEFRSVMQEIKQAGGMGHLPAIWELLSEHEAQQSLVNGRMWKLEAKGKAAVVAFTKEDKIQSLKSKWVCSIAATTPDALESALWHANSESCLSTLEGDVAFTISMDGPISHALCESLPLADDPCVIFATTCSS